MTGRARIALVAIGAQLIVAACERGKATPVTPAVEVSSAQFQQLRWLEGTWRGSGGGYDGFFEGYRWVDDSTIRQYGYSDSTFSVVNDSSVITRRGTLVRSSSERSSYVAVALDSASVRFEPERNTSNAFEWRRVNSGAWTARMLWDSAGVPRERLYEMRAYARPGPGH